MQQCATSGHTLTRSLWPRLGLSRTQMTTMCCTHSTQLSCTQSGAFHSGAPDLGRSATSTRHKYPEARTSLFNVSALMPYSSVTGSMRSLTPQHDIHCHLSSLIHKVTKCRPSSWSIKSVQVHSTRAAPPVSRSALTCDLPSPAAAGGSLPLPASAGRLAGQQGIHSLSCTGLQPYRGCYPLYFWGAGKQQGPDGCPCCVAACHSRAPLRSGAAASLQWAGRRMKYAKASMLGIAS